MDPSSTANGVLDTAFAALLTPLGIVAVLAGLGVMVAAMASRGCRWGVVGLALFMSTFELAVTDGTTIMHLWGPLDLIRNDGRLLATGALLALLLPSMLASRGWRARLISGAAIAFLLLEIVFCGRMLIAGMGTRAFASLGIFLLIFIVLARGLSMWLQDLDDVVAALRAVAFGGALFVAANALQLLASPGSAMWNGRLNGTAGNPQHMAMDMATFLPAILFLMLRKEESKLLRAALAGTVGLIVVLLGMTASRTGALMVVVVLVVMFRRWLGKFLQVAVVGCVVTFLGFLVFPDAPVQTDRFLSTQDTRSEVWSQLFADFINHPLMGYVAGEPGIRESSYLSTAARLGILGVIPLGVMVFLGYRAAARLNRIRPILGQYAMAVDVVIAGLASLAVGAVSEGFLLGTLTLQVYMVYVYLALAAFLLDLVAQSANLEPQYEESYQAPSEDFYFVTHNL